MDRSVGIFRKISQRPFQVPIRRKFVPSGVAVVVDKEAPGWLAAIRQQRQVLGKARERRLPAVHYRRNRFVPTVVPPTPSEADIGWLVYWMNRRAYSHNLRR